jgi:hypothetical protein
MGEDHHDDIVNGEIMMGEVSGVQRGDLVKD